MNKREVEQDIAYERALDILGAVKTICFSHTMFDCETIKCEDCALSKEIDLGLGEDREPFDLCELITTLRGGCEVREYRFRGLRLDGRGWVYGDLVHMASGAVHIVGRQIGEPWLGQPVDAKTVGQYIGRQDIRGCDVYEGDNVQISDGYDGTSGFGTVDFSDSSFRVNGGGITYYRWMDYDVEVIGNIHEAQS